jgi:VWFA-related protein
MPNRSLAALLACSFTAVLAASQSTAPASQEQQQPPTFRTEANFVRVDVYATLKGLPLKDLSVEDFEVLEDGVRQKVTTFEYVQIRAGIPQELRNEPNTIQASRDALKNPRARVFVLFLDVPHVTIDGTWHSREALTRMVERLMGPEDLIGVMIPHMAPTEIVFARKTEVLTRGLLDKWPWGERHTLAQDEKARLYESCYPWGSPEIRDLLREMNARRHERVTLEAFGDLVAWLRTQREERKAIITVSEGWLLYKPNADLMRLRVIDPITGEKEPVPGPDPITVGREGKITIGRAGIDPQGRPIGGPASECYNDRLHLSGLDNDRVFRDVLDIANRANASFYTIDPRGLAVFDYPIGPEKPPSILVDANHLRNRQDALRVLADNTDGLSVIGNNDLEPGLRRIADDLTSYYLLGYYSSNTKLDGRFRKLSVKVKRPGVDVRARRGYKAATAEEVAAARAAGETRVPEAASAATAALSGLARLRPEAKLNTHAIATKGTGVTVWVAGELARPVAAATTAAITVGTPPASASIEVPLAAGQRAFMGSASLTTAPPGPIEVRLRVAAPGEIPFTDTIRIDAVEGLAPPLMFRRGPATGNRYEPAGQPQFSRTERVRFDVPRVGIQALNGVRVLDRNGNPIEVPVTQSSRDGWLSVEIALAAFGPGDYLVELAAGTGGTQKVLAAFRVTR